MFRFRGSSIILFSQLLHIQFIHSSSQSSQSLIQCSYSILNGQCSKTRVHSSMFIVNINSSTFKCSLFKCSLFKFRVHISLLNVQLPCSNSCSNTIFKFNVQCSNSMFDVQSSCSVFSHQCSMFRVLSSMFMFTVHSSLFTVNVHSSYSHPMIKFNVQNQCSNLMFRVNCPEFNHHCLRVLTSGVA